MKVKKSLLTGNGIEDAILLYDKFSLVSFIVLAIMIPVVFWLAVLKPGLRKE
jgi:hypothetical protein